MKIYLDVCAIQRPLDTPSHLRIAIEAEAVRFLRQFTTGFGEYVEEREALFGGKSLAEIVDEIKGERDKGREKG